MRGGNTKKKGISFESIVFRSFFFFFWFFLSLNLMRLLLKNAGKEFQELFARIEVDEQTLRMINIIYQRRGVFYIEFVICIFLKLIFLFYEFYGAWNEPDDRIVDCGAFQLIVRSTCVPVDFSFSLEFFGHSREVLSSSSRNVLWECRFDSPSAAYYVAKKREQVDCCWSLCIGKEKKESRQPPRIKRKDPKFSK